MQLVDKEIAECIDSNILRITPYNKSQINPNSYDVRLGDEFLVYERSDTIIDPYDKETIERPVIRHVRDEIIIEPLQFMVARTIELINLPSSMCAQIGGKSSLARLGLSIHQTGGFIDAGFHGTLTLELFNANCLPIKLYSGMRIAQIMFMTCAACCKPYNVRESAKYNGQIHATLSKYNENDKPFMRIRND